MRILLILSLAFPGLAACRSAQDYSVEADEEVYALVEDRRSQLFDEDGGFTIDPPEDSLRSRILEGEVTELPDLGLTQCMEIAAENNRDYQARKEALYLAALDVTLERWRLGWISMGAGDVGIDGLADSANLASGGLGFSIEKILGTGGKILSDLGIAIAKDLSGGDGWTAQSTFSLLFTQPLLRGAGGWIVYEDLTQAERDLVYEVRNFERFRRELSVDLSKRLLRLLQTLDFIENERLNYETVHKIRERNEALSLAGQLSDIEVGQARQDELTSEDRLIVARQNYEAELDSFKLLLGLPMNVGLTVDPMELERLATLGKGLDELEPEQAIEIAYAYRPDFKTAVDQVVDAERRSRVAADALRLGLDVSSSIEVSSDSSKPLKFNFQDVGWSLGVLIDLPIDMTPERNTYRRSLITWQARVRQAQDLEDTISKELRDELREVTARRESQEVQSSAVGLAEQRVESAGLKLQAGRASTRDLLDAQDSLVSSSNAETRSMIEYTLARLDLALDMGLLRVGEEGLWVEMELESMPGSSLETQEISE